ncbi:BamA/TamA family outer membrane protein [Gracilimonas amylolytica]|uniref:BamA/TamA family outer membrane protein n=1 Tax=Gracilimonas amylolytica TaxID=1749045 RepID=UPI000CD8D0A4|nr:BamA/TamA family outer membrane protein [Gracilimonas amylolytica]
MVSKTVGVILWMMLFPAGFVYAQEVNFRVYEGTSEISIPDSVQQKLSDKTISPEIHLLQWFSAEGYLKARIDSITQNSALVTRNCAFDLKDLRWQYSGARDSVIVQNIQRPYSQKLMQQIIGSHLIELADKGFPFSKAEIIQVNPQYDECAVSVEVNVETGIRATSTDIFFTGLTTNSREYVKKVSRFQEGQVITPHYLRFIRSNLFASGLFNFAGEGQILLRDGQPVVVFEVQERSMNQFDGLLGYVPDVNGNGQIVGDVELGLWNVLAEGNGLNFQYQRLKPETSELDVSVSQDWLGDIPIGLTAGFGFYQNDTTYQSRQFEFGGSYRLSGGLRLIGGIELQSSISGTNIPVIVEPDGNKRTGRLGFEYSNLDRYDVPTSGHALSLSYGISRKDLNDDSVEVFVQNSLDLEVRQYIPVMDRSVIALSMQGYFLEADRVTLNDLFRFGGANSFRGYGEEQFRAGQLLWGDMEYQFLIDRESYLFAFGAYGAYHRPQLITETNNNLKVTKSLYSIGFGLSYQTRIGRLKFTYAISPEESLANGKVHFGIRTEL